MEFIAIMLVQVVIGAIALWLIAKLLAPEPLSPIQAVWGALVVEVIALIPVPFIGYAALVFFLILVAGFDGRSAALVTVLYTIIKIFVLVFLIQTLTNIVGV